MIDERTEQLINRKLDGELSEAESLELNKLLIREPRARALMEDYARMDEQAGEVLRAVLREPAARIEPQEVSNWTAVPRGQWWYSFGLVSAVAAAITFAVLLSQRAAMMDALTPTSVQDPRGLAQADPNGARSQTEVAWNVDGPRRETLNLDRDVIGVWDRESGSLYILEADSTQSLVEPVKANY